MDNHKVLHGCYYTYFVIGAMSLMFGAILPSLIAKSGISYDTAGILLSAHSIGFLIFGTTTGLLSEFIGRKKIALVISILLPIALFGLALTTGAVWLFIFFLVTGFARGAIINVNNITVSTLADGNPGPVNIMQSFFAAGGFVITLLISICIHLGWGFEIGLYFMTLLACVSIVIFSRMDLDSIKPKNQKRADASFIRQPDFYIVLFIMFFYLCCESSLSGWLTTYLKDSRILPSGIASLMISLIWLTMIAGRLIIAKISSRVSTHMILLSLSVGVVVSFGLFMFTQNVVMIPIIVLIIGLFLSGIYPTCVSGLNSAISFSAFGMGVAMGSAGVGSIMMPSVIGFVSNHAGITAGMMCILVAAVAMAGSAWIFFLRRIKRKNT